jgi:uncharacterized protein YciI
MAEETWVALLHRPGPDAPAEGTVFDDPRFADHIAFLRRMQEAGYLIAAGPIVANGEEPRGEGMTVLRLPGADRYEEAEHLARQDDASVAAGFFEVTVRRWRVVMHP